MTFLLCGATGCNRWREGYASIGGEREQRFWNPGTQIWKARRDDGHRAAALHAMTARAEIDVRVMTREDLDTAIEWAAAEGWNPGLDDAAIFHATDPLGFFAAIEREKPIASISIVAYPGGFGFLGLYIVQPEHRGRGVGLHLWRAALSRRTLSTIGLDGVPAQQSNYAASGFRLAYRNIRFAGPAPAMRLSGSLVDLARIPFDAVLAYDRLAFPAPRPAFLSLWTRPRGGVALATVRDGSLIGLGVMRACRSGYKVGPLFADDETLAQTLLAGLLAHADGAAVAIDVPEPNAGAVRLAEHCGFKPVFETARMYAGPAPNLPLARIFGVTSFELG